MNSRALSGLLLLGAAALLGYAWTHGMIAGALTAIGNTIGGSPLESPYSASGRVVGGNW